FFAKGYGYADLDRQIPVDPARTLFRVGSVSKLYTWTAVMQLVEQGRLDLDTDVNEYLDFAIPATFEQPITLRHLLTHTPGFEDNALGLFVLHENEVTPFEEDISQNIPTRVFPPGEISAYSNYGAALAGYIVQRVSGVPFDRYVEQNIFQPLSMAHSSFRQPLPADLAGDMSVGYRDAGGELLPGGFEYVVPYPAGSLSSSALDQAAFMIAHLQDGQLGEARILQAETARQMHSLQYAYDDRLDGWGLGFAVSAAGAEPSFGHGGDTTFFHSEMLLLPEANVGVFISTNTDTGSTPRSQFLQAFLERYFPASAPAAGTADLLPPDPAVQGVYYPTRMSFTRVEKVLSLVAPVNVAVTPDNRLQVTGLIGPEPTYWAQIEPGLFVPLGGPLPAEARLMIEDRTVGGETRPYLLIGSLSFARQPWYAASSLAILLVSLAAFLVAFVAFPVTGWLGPRYARLAGASARPAEPALTRLARWVGWALALLGLLFWMVFAVFSGDIYNLVFGLPPVLQAALWIPWIFLGLAVAAAGLSLWLWLRRAWTLPGRIGYTLLVLAALVQVWLLAFWNFL
ncbi:MAG TPA: serine hydrolase domain-containing protein, partial [Anaerolineaceae bacterium]|nr:serine hydrolase domain-containing protein [Anaerolineaceae bacterium]